MHNGPDIYAMFKAQRQARLDKQPACQVRSLTIKQIKRIIRTSDSDPARVLTSEKTT